MARVDKIIKEIELSDTENGKIKVATIIEPYGDIEKAYVSIGIFLDAQSEAPNWSAYIPEANIESVIDALKCAKEEI